MNDKKWIVTGLVVFLVLEELKAQAEGQTDE